MDLSSVVSLLNSATTSHSGTAIAALVLATLVWVLQKVPAVSDFVAKSPILAHVAMLVLAVVPAVVITLSTSGSWVDALSTAVVTFLAAVGVKGVKDTLTTSASAPASS